MRKKPCRAGRNGEWGYHNRTGQSSDLYQRAAWAFGGWVCKWRYFPWNGDGCVFPVRIQGISTRSFRRGAIFHCVSCGLSSSGVSGSENDGFLGVRLNFRVWRFFSSGLRWNRRFCQATVPLFHPNFVRFFWLRSAQDLLNWSISESLLLYRLI